jgi:hypothetical protein
LCSVCNIEKLKKISERKKLAADSASKEYWEAYHAESTKAMKAWIRKPPVLPGHIIKADYGSLLLVTKLPYWDSFLSAVWFGGYSLRNPASLKYKDNVEIRLVKDGYKVHNFADLSKVEPVYPDPGIVVIFEGLLKVLKIDLNILKV